LRREKAEYFINEKDNYKDFLLLALEEKKEAEKRILNFRGIIQDPAEYWKYVMDEGVISFLIDTYDEIYDFMQPENNEVKKMIKNNKNEKINIFFLYIL
jgi:hypothetical protein